MDKLDKKYKFVHLFLASNMGCNKNLIEMFCDKDNGFDINNFLFVTACNELYNLEKAKCNIELYENPKNSSIHMVNAYGERGEWIFVHSLPFGWNYNQIEAKYYSKILWRTWGHDVNIKYLNQYLKKIIDNPKSYALGWLRILKNWPLLLKEEKLDECRKKTVQKFHAIGIGNIIDSINIKMNFGNVLCYNMPYPSKDSRIELLTGLNGRRTDGVIHVMIGHSGFDNDSHCYVTSVLKKYEDKPIKLHFVLSYGHAPYIRKVIKYVNDNWHGDCEIITNGMSYDEYCNFINSMDVIILNGDKSYALGNLSMALTGRKTVYLNRYGILKEGLIMEGIPFHYVDEIANMTWDEFSDLLEYEVDENSTLLIQPYGKYVDMWKKILDELG